MILRKNPAGEEAISWLQMKLRLRRCSRCVLLPIHRVLRPRARIQIPKKGSAFAAYPHCASNTGARRDLFDPVAADLPLFDKQVLAPPEGGARPQSSTEQENETGRHSAPPSHSKLHKTKRK
jgi:hypothetical protein